MWKEFAYSFTASKLFTPDECNSIISSSKALTPQISKMEHVGQPHRDSGVYWLPTDGWVGERLRRAIAEYNAGYGFDINPQLEMAQLTEYRPGQFYGWHTDIGGGPMSLRKISVVVELQSAEAGGGLEILNQTVHLGVGDAVLFPSFLMHRALPVIRGVRWSLVQWVLGPAPFR